MAVCAQLGAVKARELAQIIGIVLPVDFKGASDAAILKRGKNALMSKIRATYKAHGVRHTGEIEE